MQLIDIEVRGFHKKEAQGVLEGMLHGAKGVVRYELDNPNKRVLILIEDWVKPMDIKELFIKHDFSVGNMRVTTYTGK